MFEFKLKPGKDNYGKCDGMYIVDKSKKYVNNKPVYVNYKRRTFLAALGNTGWCITYLKYWEEVKNKRGKFGGLHSSLNRNPHNGWKNYTVKTQTPPGKKKPGKKFDSRTKRKIIASLDNTLRSLSSIDKQLAVMIKRLVVHQKAMRATKWGTTAATVASTILCFTPFAPIGVAGLTATSVVGTGATIRDTHVTSRDQKRVEALAKKAKISLQQTDRALRDAMKITYKYGTSVRKVTRFGGMAAAGKIGISTASKALAGIGAALSLADAISTQAKENPSLQNARNLQKDIKQQYRQISAHKANIQKDL